MSLSPRAYLLAVGLVLLFVTLVIGIPRMAASSQQAAIPNDCGGYGTPSEALANLPPALAMLNSQIGQNPLFVNAADGLTYQFEYSQQLSPEIQVINATLAPGSGFPLSKASYSGGIVTHIPAETSLVYYSYGPGSQALRNYCFDDLRNDGQVVGVISVDVPHNTDGSYNTSAISVSTDPFLIPQASDWR